MLNIKYRERKRNIGEREDKGHRCNGTNQTTEVEQRKAQQNEITEGYHVLTLRHLTEGSGLEETGELLAKDLTMPRHTRILKEHAEAFVQPRDTTAAQ